MYVYILHHELRLTLLRLEGSLIIALLDAIMNQTIRCSDELTVCTCNGDPGYVDQQIMLVIKVSIVINNKCSLYHE